MKNKWLKLCVVGMMLFTFFGMSASKVANAETPEVQSVNIADFTKEQREAIQSGEPTTSAQAGQATLYGYELDKGKCPSGDTLPNTGSSSTTILAVLGIVSLSGAAYFLVSNKKAKKTILMIELVAAVATTSVSAVTPYEQSLIDMGCFRYVGYIREDVSTTTEATTSSATTTEAATTEEVTTEETTVETTTTEITTTTTTESTTETAATQSVEPITVAPTDYL